MRSDIATTEDTIILSSTDIEESVTESATTEQSATESIKESVTENATTDKSATESIKELVTENVTEPLKTTSPTTALDSRTSTTKGTKFFW